MGPLAEILQKKSTITRIVNKNDYILVYSRGSLGFLNLAASPGLQVQIREDRNISVDLLFV